MGKAGAVKQQTVQKSADKRGKRYRSDGLSSGSQLVNRRKGKTSTLSAAVIDDSSDDGTAHPPSNEEDDDDSSTADTQSSSHDDDDDDNDEEPAADAAPQSTGMSETLPRRPDADAAKPKKRNVDPATEARKQARTQRQSAIFAKMKESMPSDTYIVTSMIDKLYERYAELAKEKVSALDGPGAHVVCKKWDELSTEDLICRIVLVIAPKKNQSLTMAALGPRAADLYSDAFGLTPTTNLSKNLFLPRMLLLAVDSGAMKSALATNISAALTPMLSPTAARYQLT
jgi:hypothetical protein